MNNEKDDIEKLFESMHGQLDIYEPERDHKLRFLQKLQQQNGVVSIAPARKKWLRPLAIAASVLVLFGAFTFMNAVPSQEEADLASISPQMEETQNFFTVAISSQLEEIQKIKSSETEALVNDVMKQLEVLETDYKQLKKDLVNSGNDKRVISAMIKNFQKRAALLEAVLEKMNTIKTLKTSENENYIL